MSYALGVDLGTTFSAAAVARGNTSAPVALGAETSQIPSVVLFREDGEIVVGEAAERRAVLEPSRVAREFKRRLGDSVPIVIAGQPHRSEDMMAAVLAEIVRQVTVEHGEPPGVVVLTHPANYSDHKLGLLRAAASRVGVADDSVILLSEPEAAAVAYSRQRVIEVGDVVAVYDFGGGTFDAALVRRGPNGFELIGVPEGMERLGGIDIDQALLAHVDGALEGAVGRADRSDPVTMEALVRLRGECRRAKEALSADTETSVPVAIPGVSTSVRVTRAELEDMVRPRIADSIHALERAVASAGVTMAGVARVLLVGGTSRMPLVAQMVEAATGRPVALDVHPKLAVPVGAALIGAATSMDTSAVQESPAGPLSPPPSHGPSPLLPTPLPGTVPIDESSPSSTAETDTWTAPANPTRPRRGEPTVEAPTTSKRRGSKLTIGIGIAAGVAFVAALALIRGSGGDRQGATANTVGSEATNMITIPSGETAGAVGSAVSPGVAGVVDRYAFGGVAGTGVPGPRLEAGVPDIVALTVDPSGRLFVVSADGRVLIVEADKVTELATMPAADGVPGGIAVTPDGQILVTTAKGVERLDDGALSLVFDGAEVGLGRTPGALAVDGVGNIYVADTDHHRVIRRGIDASLSLVAGNGASPAGVTPDGVRATSVAIGRVSALAIDTRGDLIIGDDESKVVRMVSTDNMMRTIAGGGTVAVESWVTGTPATSLALQGIDGVGADAAGRVYVADTATGVILRFATDGVAEVVIVRQPGMEAVNGVAANASSVGALGPLVASTTGDLFFADDATVRRVPV